MAGRTIAEAASERETLTRDPLMWHGTIVTQDRLCSEMLATFRMSRAKSGLSTNGPFPAIPPLFHSEYVIECRHIQPALDCVAVDCAACNGCYAPQFQT